MRTLVIGDIHGADVALQQILERANVTMDDTLIFLGDYVDGWSGSFQVIKSLIALSEKQHCIFLKGNHDVWFEEYLNTGMGDETWLKHGGIATIESYTYCDEITKQQHIGFFKNCLDYYIDTDNRLFIHAGFCSMHGPVYEHCKSNFNCDRTLWEMALTIDKRISPDSLFYPHRLKLFKEIYIGHTPTTNYNIELPINAMNVWNLDTGAAFTGKLSIMDIATNGFWQSDTIRKLYPNEKGRNKK